MCVNLTFSVICIHSETEATQCFSLKCINSMDCLLLGVSAEGHYLYFDLDFLSRCYQLIQCLLGVLHVAAVLPVDQQPGEGYKATRLVNLNTLPQHGEEITHSDKVKTFRLMFDHGCFWPKNIYYILIWSHSRVKTQVGLSLKSI